MRVPLQIGSPCGPVTTAINLENRMKFLKLSVLAMVAALSLSGASTGWAQQPTSPPCNEVNTPFQQLYAQQVQQQTGVDRLLYDVEWHSYRFKVNTNMTMCSIGYTTPPLAPVKYRFKLVEVGNPNALLDVVFNSPLTAFPPQAIGLTTYQPVTPTPLLVGHTYELRRQATVHPGGDYMELIGRVLTNQLTYDIATPAMTVKRTKFYDSNTQIVKQALPFIDFGTW